VYGHGEQELKEIINPPPPPPEPGTKKKVKGSKAARAQAKRFKEGLKVCVYVYACMRA
jgi:hypothetical protein